MLFISIILFIFCFESMIKQHMDQTLPLNGSRQISGGLVVLKKYYNTGAAGNFLQRHPGGMRGIHAIALCLAAAWAAALPKKGQAMAKVGLSFLVGGGGSNLHDRITKGHVVDYFRFGFGPLWFRRLVFNLADLFIFAGMALCGIALLKKDKE